MTAQFMKFFSNAPGGWILGIALLIAIGPAGVMSIVDRIFPPVEKTVMEDVGDKVGVLQRSNRYQLDKLIDRFDALSDDIKALTTMIFLMHDRLDDHERRWNDYFTAKQNPEDQTLGPRYRALPPGTP